MPGVGPVTLGGIRVSIKRVGGLRAFTGTEIGADIIAAKDEDEALKEGVTKSLLYETCWITEN